MKRIAGSISGLAYSVIIPFHESIAKRLKRSRECAYVPHRTSLAVLEVVNNGHDSFGGKIAFAIVVITLTIETVLVLLLAVRHSNGNHYARRPTHWRSAFPVHSPRQA